MHGIAATATAAIGSGPVLFGPVLGSALLGLLAFAMIALLLVVLVVRTAVGIAWKLLPVAAVVLLGLWLFGFL